MTPLDDSNVAEEIRPQTTNPFKNLTEHYYAAGLRYDDNQPSIVARETALKWATAAVTWAQDQIQRGKGPSVDDADASS